jgi:hypothetical protein
MRNVGIKYRPHSYLKEFHLDRLNYFIRAIVTGYGGGKTYAGCMELIQASAINKGVPNLYIEPTYQMIKDILEPQLIKILEENKIPFQLNKSEHNITIPLWDGIIWLRSGDKPEKIKGINAGIVGIDEPFIQDEEIFKIAVSRARHPKAKVKGVFLTGTPEQLNWGYELLVEKLQESTKVYKGSTFDNLIYLGSDYVENLQKHYSEKEARAYIHGEFVNLTSGQTYYSFTDANIIDGFNYMNHRPLEISCDFNVDIMTWNIGQELNGKDYVFDFVELEGQANTQLLCEMLKSKYAMHKGQFIFYGDSSGAQRSPQTAKTNWSIIRENFPNAEIYYQQIRNIKDRVDSFNARIKNSKEEKNWFVTKNCKRLIKDMRQVTWEMLLNKNKAKKLTHASDGECYKMYWKYRIDKIVTSWGKYV